MTNIKAIVFDIGGILLSEPGVKSREILADKFNFKTEDFSNFALKNLKRSCKGLDSKIFFKELINELKINAKPEDMEKSWLKAREQTTKFNIDVKNLIINLNKNYLVACFTNTTKLNDKVNFRKQAYKLFKINLLSINEKLCKPEIEFYDLLVSKLKENSIFPEQTILIDDKEQNLIPAKNLGIKTILFKDNNQLIRDLIALGVKIGN